MSYKIDEIEGIGPAFRTKLEGAGVKTTDDLLAHCGTAPGRKATAEKSGVTESNLLKWANMADLMRIKGVGPEYAELLEAAGVDTVKELRTRRADNLAAKMAEVNEARKLTRTVPVQSAVEGWVEAAKGMEPKISH